MLICKIATKKHGSALITALFIMALIAAAATAMIYQLQQSIDRSQQIFNYNQALQYNNSIVDWAITLLQTDKKNVSTTIPLKIPILYPQKTVTGGYYRGVILSMDGKFNLNTLSNKANIPGFTHMLQLIFADSTDVKSLAAAIVDWVTFNPRNNLDAAYKKAGYSYASPHQPMINISELRRVLGVTQAIYRRLLPYVTAIPNTRSMLNINTTSAMALTSVSPTLSLQTAQSIINSRPFLNSEQLAQNPLVKRLQIANKLSIHSQIFTVRSLVKLGQQTLLTNNYLSRNPSTGQVVVLWQTQGSSA